MLVLCRKCDETIRIGDDIVITVVRLYRHKVRLGISGAPHIVIHRGEVYDAIQEQQAGAERGEGGDPR